MFSEELMARLAQMVDACPFPLRAVASLKQWADGAGPRHFREQTPPELCESSWTAARTLSEKADRGTPVYIYVRS